MHLEWGGDAERSQEKPGHGDLWISKCARTRAQKRPRFHVAWVSRRTSRPADDNRARGLADTSAISLEHGPYASVSPRMPGTRARMSGDQDRSGLMVMLALLLRHQHCRKESYFSLSLFAPPLFENPPSPVSAPTATMFSPCAMIFSYCAKIFFSRAKKDLIFSRKDLLPPEASLQPLPKTGHPRSRQRTYKFVPLFPHTFEHGECASNATRVASIGLTLPASPFLTECSPCVRIDASPYSNHARRFGIVLFQHTMYMHVLRRSTGPSTLPHKYASWGLHGPLARLSRTPGTHPCACRQRAL